MKKTKVIIPALGLLLLSTAASVTGTVAWFAANAEVHANGMQITAKTDSEFLVISKSSTLASLSTVSLANPSGYVFPTNWVDTNGAEANGYSWVTGAGQSTSVGTINASGYTNLSLSEANNFGTDTTASKNYYVYDSVFVGIATGSSTPSHSKVLKASVEFDCAQESNLNACLTVAFDVSADKASAADFDERILMGQAADATVAGSNVLLYGDDLSTTGVEIKVFAFFNGDDSSCTTANAVSLDAITLNITFTLANA